MLTKLILKDAGMHENAIKSINFFIQYCDSVKSDFFDEAHIIK
jgi:hypothetical protein